MVYFMKPVAASTAQTALMLDGQLTSEREKMSPWERLLQQPHPRGHVVQLYEADGPLTENVDLYIREGMSQGEGILVVATPEHADLFCRHLNQLTADLPELLRRKQLINWDAQWTLTQIMFRGQPDWRSFEAVMRAGMSLVRPAKNRDGVRVYNEMVSILWKAQRFTSAIRLEQLWNRLLEQVSFSLYCAYEIDIFGKEFAAPHLDGVLCAHTHLIPSRPNGPLETALNLSMDEILGPEADAVRALIQSSLCTEWAIMPNAEATVLCLKKHKAQNAVRSLPEPANTTST
jgi:hypothetical protein